MNNHITLFSRKPLFLYLFKTNPAIYIFLSTILAYVIAIIYESSYLQAFDVSPQVIEVSPVVLFYSLILVFVGYALLEFYSQLNYFFTLKSKEAAKEKNLYKRYSFTILDSVAHILYVLIYMNIFVNFVSIGNINANSILLGFVLLGFFILFAVSIPILYGLKTIIKKRSFRAGIERYYKSVDKNNKRIEKAEKNSKPFLDDRFGLWVTFFVLIFCVPSIYATDSARAENKFYV